jgi:hypothetical protein
VVIKLGRRTRTGGYQRIIVLMHSLHFPQHPLALALH